MISGEHCAICKASNMCEHFEATDEYCREIKEDYEMSKAADETVSVFDDCILKLKEICVKYKLPMFIVLTMFDKMCLEERELYKIEDDFLKAIGIDIEKEIHNHAENNN